MSGADEDALSFDSSPTGRFGLAAVTERGRERDTAPVRAQGTPPPITTPVASLTTGPISSEIPTPTDVDATVVNPPSPFDGPPSFDAPPSLFDGPTLDRTPFPPGLLEEGAPLDRDPTEAALLAAISSGDESSRLVYADWLEERSEHARAGYLRLEQLVSRLSPGDPRYDACTRQLRELVDHIDPDWRARVARPPIEGCPAFAFRCPQRWDALARTDREAVRYCRACAKHVYYFESVDEARPAARQGHCVAIDLGSERWENDFVDIGTRCPGCSRRVVSTARFCPHCGDALHRSAPVLLGRLAIDD